MRWHGSRRASARIAPGGHTAFTGSRVMPAARDLYTVADLRDWPAATAGVQPPLRLAVFGDPVAHSASPPMQNAALAARGCDLRYTRVHVRPEELAEALQLAGRYGFIGVNLTIPHKEAGLSLVDALNCDAERLGVINTVRFERTAEGMRRRGVNTDGAGLARAGRTALGRGRAAVRVLILGAGGGAGRALATQCVEEGCSRLVLVNRTFEKTRALAGKLHSGATAVEALPWESAALRRVLADTDLVVNASALGLKPDDPSPLPPEIIPTRVRVFDTVYRRDGAPTSLERAAHEAGARSVGGRALLLHQGALAFEHWFGGTAPLEDMRRGLV